jgi:hypothetical protein
MRNITFVVNSIVLAAYWLVIITCSHIYATGRNLQDPINLYHSPGAFAHYIIELLHIVSYDSNYQKERDGITLTD